MLHLLSVMCMLFSDNMLTDCLDGENTNFLERLVSVLYIQTFCYKGCYKFISQ